MPGIFEASECGSCERQVVRDRVEVQDLGVASRNVGAQRIKELSVGPERLIEAMAWRLCSQRLVQPVGVVGSVGEGENANGVAGCAFSFCGIELWFVKARYN
jgi:hypothetical protein